MVLGLLRNKSDIVVRNVTVQNTNMYELFLKLFIYILFIYLFIFWLRWVFVAVRGLSPVAASGGYSSLRCTGFSLQWLLLLWSTGPVIVVRRLSSCGSRALERRLSSYGARA